MILFVMSIGSYITFLLDTKKNYPIQESLTDCRFSLPLTVKLFDLNFHLFEFVSR